MRILEPADIGLFIRDYRRDKGLSQSDLAAAAGVSRRWLANLENGKSTVELALVLKTLTALDLALDIGLVSEKSKSFDLDDVLRARE
jgi:y4mF family transcriptional regulator